MVVLLAGGAGYIGSHTAVELINAGHEVVIVDNLVNSSEKSIQEVEKILGKSITFYNEDIRNKSKLLEIFLKEKPTGLKSFWKYLRRTKISLHSCNTSESTK